MNLSAFDSTGPLPQGRPGCALLQLPADVRNIVYALVFREDQGIHVDFSSIDGHESLRNFFALAFTCKELYHETVELPYWLNVFHFHVPVLQNMESLFTATRPLETWPNRPKPQTNPFCTSPGLPAAVTIWNKKGSLRQKSEEFVSTAVRSPHAKDVAHRLSKVTHQTRILSRLYRVHVHLGSQVNNTFVERFFHAWSEVEASLRDLSSQVDTRISFDLRISRWLVVHYDFGTDSPEDMLAEMDRCVRVNGVLTLPEVSTINAVRMRVWRTFFETPQGYNRPRPFEAVPRREMTGAAPHHSDLDRAEELIPSIAIAGGGH